jgi:hypothetical protein
LTLLTPLLQAPVAAAPEKRVIKPEERLAKNSAYLRARRARADERLLGERKRRAEVRAKKVGHELWFQSGVLSLAHWTVVFRRRPARLARRRSWRWTSKLPNLENDGCCRKRGAV